MTTQKVVETPSSPSSMGEIGLGGVPEAIKFDGKALHIPDVQPEDLNKMLKADGEIGGIYRILTTPLRGAKIEVQEAHGRGKTEANFIREVLLSPYAEGGMIIPLETVIATILRKLVDGWSPHEIVWEVRDGYVRVDKIDHRPVHSIEPILDEKNNLAGYEQDLSKVDKAKVGLGSSKVRIREDKIMHFVNAPEWNPIFGRSAFIQAYYHFEKKHKLYYISHIAAQINALRLRRIKVPKDKEDQIQKYTDLVAKLGFNTTIALPEDIELELLETGNQFLDILPLIQHHDSQASKSLLAQVIDLGVEGRTGSFNLSDTHLDVFIANLELMGNYIARVFNSVLIPKLIDWNFGTGNYPKVQFRPFDRLVKNQLFEVYTRIVGAANLNASPEFLLAIEKEIANTTGLNIEYEAIEENIKVFFREKALAQAQSGSDSSSGAGDPDTRDRSSRTD